MPKNRHLIFCGQAAAAGRRDLMPPHRIHTLAVRYCGGCRTEYDRPALVRAIVAGLAAKGMEVALDYGDLRHAVGILVCGCPTQCPLRGQPLPSGFFVLGPDGRFNGGTASSKTVVHALYNAFCIHNGLAVKGESR